MRSEIFFEFCVFAKNLLFSRNKIFSGETANKNFKKSYFSSFLKIVSKIFHQTFVLVSIYTFFKNQKKSKKQQIEKIFEISSQNFVDLCFNLEKLFGENFYQQFEKIDLNFLDVNNFLKFREKSFGFDFQQTQKFLKIVFDFLWEKQETEMEKITQNFVANFFAQLSRLQNLPEPDFKK